MNIILFTNTNLVFVSIIVMLKINSDIRASFERKMADFLLLDVSKVFLPVYLGGLFINDLSDVISYSLCHLFTDYVQIYVKFDSLY